MAVPKVPNAPNVSAVSKIPIASNGSVVADGGMEGHRERDNWYLVKIPRPCLGDLDEIWGKSGGKVQKSCVAKPSEILATY